MRILITNNTLAARAGTELYVRDIALRLRELGHTPVCFTMQRGEVADEVEAGGVEVITTLAHAHGPFDLIHGHHELETSLAAMAFPRVPVLSFCHGPKAWQEKPAMMPNVVHYVAVDEACRDRLLDEGINAEKITLLLNFADTRRFASRPPLPATPRTALVFSNTASQNTHLPVVQKACEMLGIRVDVVGLASGHTVKEPEKLLQGYELVFAKARAAIEAMAVGCAVIQCDYFGAGWLITQERFDALRPVNFGYRSMTAILTPEHLVSQILAYDPADAAAVSARIRGEASLDAAMPQLLALYRQVADTAVPEFDPWEAGTRFLHAVFDDAKAARNHLPRLEAALEESQNRRSTQNTKLTALRQKKDLLKSENAKLKQNLRTMQADLARHRRPWWKKLFKP